MIFDCRWKSMMNDHKCSDKYGQDAIFLRECFLTQCSTNYIASLNWEVHSSSFLFLSMDLTYQWDEHKNNLLFVGGSNYTQISIITRQQITKSIIQIWMIWICVCYPMSPNEDGGNNNEFHKHCMRLKK